ncbi:hypothetical protein GQR58_020553 [Nymphon striatum]|nr:hypothetical protein GQR58_020553 [Nymphon striatum]
MEQIVIQLGRQTVHGRREVNKPPRSLKMIGFRGDITENANVEITIYNRKTTSLQFGYQNDMDIKRKFGNFSTPSSIVPSSSYQSTVDAALSCVSVYAWGFNLCHDSNLHPDHCHDFGVPACLYIKKKNNNDDNIFNLLMPYKHSWHISMDEFDHRSCDTYESYLENLCNMVDTFSLHFYILEEVNDYVIKCEKHKKVPGASRFPQIYFIIFFFRISSSLLPFMLSSAMQDYLLLTEYNLFLYFKEDMLCPHVILLLMTVSMNSHQSFRETVLFSMSFCKIIFSFVNRLKITSASLALEVTSGVKAFLIYILSKVETIDIFVVTHRELTDSGGLAIRTFGKFPVGRWVDGLVDWAIQKLRQQLYEDYVAQRINGDVSLWAPVKKQKNMIYMSSSKKQAVKILDQTVDLKETRSLYGRLMVLTRSNRDIDQKNAVGNYEFTLTPRALFSPDGSMLPCTDKSKLIHDLQKLEITADINEQEALSINSTNSKIAIVDGMVLKTRERRRQGTSPVQYQISDDTQIKHIPLTRFLSHEKTKADLTDYLAKVTLDFQRDSPQLVITSASGHTNSNRNLTFEEKNHEEADTLMICLAVEASHRYPDAQLIFFTPDTDVLVLVVSKQNKIKQNKMVPKSVKGHRLQWYRMASVLQTTRGKQQVTICDNTCALEEHIKRVRLQSRVWCQATVMQQQPFEPLEFGYCIDTDGLRPVTTKILPAPQAIIELVRCQFKTNCSSQRCSCRKNNLTCTELCLCDTECTNDEDSNIENDEIVNNGGMFMKFNNRCFLLQFCRLRPNPKIPEVIDNYDLLLIHPYQYFGLPFLAGLPYLSHDYKIYHNRIILSVLFCGALAGNYGGYGNGGYGYGGYGRYGGHGNRGYGYDKNTLPMTDQHTDHTASKELMVTLRTVNYKAGKDGFQIIGDDGSPKEDNVARAAALAEVAAELAKAAPVAPEVPDVPDVPEVAEADPPSYGHGGYGGYGGYGHGGYANGGYGYGAGYGHGYGGNKGYRYGYAPASYGYSVGYAPGYGYGKGYGHGKW